MIINTITFWIAIIISAITSSIVTILIFHKIIPKLFVNFIDDLIGEEDAKKLEKRITIIKEKLSDTFEITGVNKIKK